MACVWVENEIHLFSCTIIYKVLYSYDLFLKGVMPGVVKENTNSLFPGFLYSTSPQNSLYPDRHLFKCGPYKTASLVFSVDGSWFAYLANLFLYTFNILDPLKSCPTFLPLCTSILIYFLLCPSPSYALGPRMAYFP